MSDHIKTGTRIKKVFSLLTFYLTINFRDIITLLPILVINCISNLHFYSLGLIFTPFFFFFSRESRSKLQKQVFNKKIILTLQQLLLKLLPLLKLSRLIIIILFNFFHQFVMSLPKLLIFFFFIFSTECLDYSYSWYL